MTDYVVTDTEIAGDDRAFSSFLLRRLVDNTEAMREVNMAGFCANFAPDRPLIIGGEEARLVPFYVEVPEDTTTIRACLLYEGVGPDDARQAGTGRWEAFTANGKTFQLQEVGNTFLQGDGVIRSYAVDLDVQEVVEQAGGRFLLLLRFYGSAYGSTVTLYPERFPSSKRRLFVFADTLGDYETLTEDIAPTGLADGDLTNTTRVPIKLSTFNGKGGIPIVNRAYYHVKAATFTPEQWEDADGNEYGRIYGAYLLVEPALDNLDGIYSRRDVDAGTPSNNPDSILYSVVAQRVSFIKLYSAEFTPRRDESAVGLVAAWPWTSRAEARQALSSGAQARASNVARLHAAQQRIFARGGVTSYGTHGLAILDAADGSDVYNLSDTTDYRRNSVVAVVNVNAPDTEYTVFEGSTGTLAEEAYTVNGAGELLTNRTIQVSFQWASMLRDDIELPLRVHVWGYDDHGDETIHEQFDAAITLTANADYGISEDLSPAGYLERNLLPRAAFHPTAWQHTNLDGVFTLDALRFLRVQTFQTDITTNEDTRYVVVTVEVPNVEDALFTAHPVNYLFVLGAQVRSGQPSGWEI